MPWESCRGRGRLSSNLDETENGVKREGPPGPQSRPWRLPPPLFTYEVAHGGRIGIPVTLPKRHSSPTKPGPGNPPPPFSGSRLHPLGAPGSSSSPGRFPGSAEAARPARPLRGAGHPAWGAGAGTRGVSAPATCPAGAARRWRSRLQGARAGGGGRVEPPREPPGARGLGTQVGLSPPRSRWPWGGGGGVGTAWGLETRAMMPPLTGQVTALLRASCSPL